MTQTPARKTVLGLGLLFLAGAALVSLTPELIIPPPPPSESRAIAPPRGLQSHPKLESSLDSLSKTALSRGADAALAFGRRSRLDVRDGSVRVVVEVRSADSRTLAGATVVVRNSIAGLGGRVEAQHRRLVQAFIPISALAVLADDPLVGRVRPPLKPFKQEVVSEGVRISGANTWKNTAAYRTQPAKICVLDAGFDGYFELLGTELPAKVKTRSFRNDNDILAGESHGTACAEIVHDMAPDAELWLVNFETDVEQHLAVDWILDQDVQVISYSLGWYNAGAGDGTGPICEDVAIAAARGVFWASAAGNAALDHWDGSFTDPDGDGMLEFSGADHILQFYVPAFTTTGAFLNWKDWGTWTGSDYIGTDQDYDLQLWWWTGSGWQFVDSSENDQASVGGWPTEEVFGWFAPQSGYWGVSVTKYRATRSVNLELFAYNNYQPVEYNITPRSLIVPADSPQALAAGASDAVDDSFHTYSGRGPTWDGRLKPDFAAPSGVSTAIFGPENFWGTSASAPHLAGALGLFLGRTPFSPTQIRKILVSRAVDLGDPGPDSKFGFGRLELGRR